jgi:hypothetical protein
VTLDRVESLLFGRSDPTDPISAQEVADRLNCGILVSYRYLTELKELGVVDSKRLENKKLVWWVPEETDHPTSHLSTRYLRNEVKKFCAEERVIEEFTWFAESASTN